MRLDRTLRLTLAVLVLAAAGCATQSALDEARTQFEAGRGEEALAVLDKAMKQDPGNLELRKEYVRTRELLVTQWLAQAESMRYAGQLDIAAALYRRVQRIDSANARAKAGLAQIDADRRHREIVAAAEKLVKNGDYRDAQDLLRPVLMEDPAQHDARRLQRTIDDKLVRPAYAEVRLKPTTVTPISLELRDVTLRSVFNVLSRASGVTFILDKDVHAEQRTSLVVRDATVEEAMRMVLLANQLGDELLNETTVLVYPDTPVKRREHQELVVRTFYLANAEVKQTANMVRAVVKTRDLFIDEKRNLLVVRDTPKAVRLIDKLIATQDLAEPEVMLELEVLEIGSNRLRELGMRFPDSVAWSLVGGGAANPNGTPGVLSLPEWLNRDANLVRLTFTDPLFLLSLTQQDSSTRVLANPRIRVKNKEKAKIHIGDRVPVITTTASATAGFISENVSYLDVGLKLEVEPLVYLDDEVDIKVGLEVSSIVRSVQSPNSATLVYQIGTRNASTTLRLRDGETQVLAGLISDEDRQTANRVPGLGDLPVLGRLFSSTSDNKTKNEIVLLITPRLVRTLARPGANAVEFAAGTEASGGAPPLIPTRPPARARARSETPTTSGQPSGSSIVPFGGVQRPNK
jgi:general secretion pathway protein D